MGILDEILRKKKERLGHSKATTPLKGLKARLADLPAPLGFKGAIKRTNGIRLIAELKKASPSRGIIRLGFDPVKIARIYLGKADAISVLTEEDFFMGDLSYIKAVKGVSDKPVLRKDFIFDEYQIYESRANGSDAILLIADILHRAEAGEFLDLASELGLSVIFEVHDMKGLELAMLTGADIIGINNRNLRTMKVDLNTTLRLKREIPAGKVIVSESGISKRDDVLMLEAGGIDAILVGTTLMEAEDISKKIDELMGVGH